MHGMVRWIHRDRHGFKEEPYEVILHVRICAGDGQQWPFLPRSFFREGSQEPAKSPSQKVVDRRPSVRPGKIKVECPQFSRPRPDSQDVREIAEGKRS